MNRKKIIIYVLLYATLIITVPFFFSPNWLKDFPTMEIYNGSLSFSGEAAYEKLNTLINKYPHRTIGLKNSALSAQWMKDEFEDLGLEVEIQRFKSPSAPLNNEGNVDFLKMISNSIKKDTIGYNVIGISPGKTSEVIVIGAHRDTLGTVQGAEDNGSGTATIIELARVLTETEHKYTYMFVSFDGEEIGLIGSKAFVSEYVSFPIELAVIFDMTGYTEADTVGFYQYTTAKGATPLWTMALGNNILDTHSLPSYYFDDPDQEILIKWINKKIRGIANTDSGPFTDKNIPSIGVMAAKANETDFFSDRNPKRPIHTPDDTMDKVSPQTMEVIGKFGEQLIKSVELNEIKSSLKITDYLIMKNQIFPSTPIIFYIILFIFGLLLLTYLSSPLVFKKRSEFMTFLKLERKWIILTTMLSLFLSCFWQLLRIEFFHSHQETLGLMVPLWAAIGFIGAILIIIFRTLSFKKRRVPQIETPNYQKGFLNLLYCLIFFILYIAYNPFIAITSILLPGFIMGRIRYHNLGLRIFWIILTLIYPIGELCILFFSSFTDGYLLALGSIDLLFLLFLHYLLILFPIIYIISVPPKIKNKNHASHTISI